MGQVKTSQKIFNKCINALLCVLCPVLSSHRLGRTRVLFSACKTDRADFTDCIIFLLSSLTEEINPNTDVLSENT